MAEAHVQRQTVEVALTSDDLEWLIRGGVLSIVPDHGDMELSIKRGDR